MAGAQAGQHDMNFRRTFRSEEPEINLIPFIDVLLVVLIFLVLSTTYARFTELQIMLPVAGQTPQQQRAAEIHIAVAADGRCSIDGKSAECHSVALLAAALRQAAAQRNEPYLVIAADAGASHQAVVRVLDAARRAELARITFAAQRDAADE